MPPLGEEVYLTEREVKILSIFVQDKVLGDLEVAQQLRDLSHKLIKHYALGDK